MKKRLWITFVVTLIMVASYFVIRANIISHREYQIFCKTLTPGMNVNNVLNSLKEFGDISYSTPLSSEDPYDAIAVGFTDLQVVGQKTYILYFQHGKYSGVGVIAGFWEGKGVGSVNSVCDP